MRIVACIAFPRKLDLFASFFFEFGAKSDFMFLSFSLSFGHAIWRNPPNLQGAIMTDIHITSCHERERERERTIENEAGSDVREFFFLFWHEKDYFQILFPIHGFLIFVVVSKHFLGALTPKIFFLGREAGSCDSRRKWYNSDLMITTER